MKVIYLDGKPVTDGKVELQVSRSRFYYIESKKLFQKTYSVKNGMIPVVLEDLPHDTETLDFSVSNFYLMKTRVWLRYLTNYKTILASIILEFIFTINFRRRTVQERYGPTPRLRLGILQV